MNSDIPAEDLTKDPAAETSSAVNRLLPIGHRFTDDEAVMQYALRIALRGVGHVEPNPPVGAVIVDQNRRLIAAGYHQKYGQPHAEVNAMRQAEAACKGSLLFVTLEPCSHHGKTPPCADAVIAAGFQKVVVGCTDPAPHVSGRGIARIRAAGIEVVTDLCVDEAERLIAPFRMLQCGQRPWIHAKWAMTLDGRIAARTGHSKWISCQQSRQYVHELRGRMDAIITGAGTVRADDPQLTARPPGPRTALRVVLDRSGRSLVAGSAMLNSVALAPILMCTGPDADDRIVSDLQRQGVQILQCGITQTGQIQLPDVLAELTRRQCTNVLIEAGAGVLGSFFDQQLIDEVHAFISPKLVGGSNASAVFAGNGLDSIPASASLSNLQWRPSGIDILCHGDVCR